MSTEFKTVETQSNWLPKKTKLSEIRRKIRGIKKVRKENRVNPGT